MKILRIVGQYECMHLLSPTKQLAITTQTGIARKASAMLVWWRMFCSRQDCLIICAYTYWAWLELLSYTYCDICCDYLGLSDRTLVIWINFHMNLLPHLWSSIWYFIWQSCKILQVVGKQPFPISSGCSIFHKFLYVCACLSVAKPVLPWQRPVITGSPPGRGDGDDAFPGPKFLDGTSPPTGNCHL